MISNDELERRFNDLIATATELLPGESFAEARHYMDHGELELALDTVAATLTQARKRANPKLYTQFLAIAKGTGIEEGFWDAVRPAE